MAWDERTVEGSVIFVWAMAVLAIVMVVAAFELGVFIGRHDARMEREVPSESASTNPQAEETQSTSPVSQVAEPPKAVQYTTQVGSFSSYQNAAALVNTLRGDGQTCWMEPESPSNTVQMVYRVFVGRFRTRKAGEQVGEVLIQRLSSITEYTIKEIKE